MSWFEWLFGAVFGLLLAGLLGYVFLQTARFLMAPTLSACALVTEKLVKRSDGAEWEVLPADTDSPANAQLALTVNITEGEAVKRVHKAIVDKHSFDVHAVGHLVECRFKDSVHTGFVLLEVVRMEQGAVVSA